MHNYKERRINNLIASLKLIGFYKYMPSFTSALNEDITLVYKINDSAIMNVNIYKNLNTFTAAVRHNNKDTGIIEQEAEINDKTLSRVINILDNVINSYLTK